MDIGNKDGIKIHWYKNICINLFIYSTKKYRQIYHYNYSIGFVH